MICKFLLQIYFVVFFLRNLTSCVKYMTKIKLLFGFDDSFGSKIVSNNERTTKYF